MKITKKSINIITTFLKTNVQAHLAYKWQSLMWIVNGFITPLVLMSIWMYIQKNQPLALDQNQILTYFLLSMVVTRLTQSWTAERLSTHIKMGSFSMTLVKPYNYQLNYIGNDLGNKVVRIVSLIPFVALAVALFSQRLSLFLAAPDLLLFALSLIGGYILSYQIENIVGLTAFWLEQAYGAFLFYQTLIQLFTGSLIPFVLMPEELKQLSYLLPFQFFISFPIQILMRQYPRPLIQGFLILLFWIIVTKLLGTYIFRQGIKKYTSVGI